MALSPELSNVIAKVESIGLGDLNEIERVQLRAWEFGRMTRMQNQFYDYQRGYLDADVEEDSLMNAALLLERWEALGVVVTDPDFLEAIRNKKQEMMEAGR